MEKIRTIITHKLQKVSRGYSDKDMAEAQRISAGDITPGDRDEFRLESQKEILGGDDPKILQVPVPTRVEITQEIRTELGRIKEMPDDEIDAKLVEKASDNLSEWGQDT